jgi:hypothetical protein
MKRKKKGKTVKFFAKLFVVFVFIALLVGLVGGIYCLYKNAYQKQKAEIEREIREIPVFSEEDAARTRNWEYPPAEPAKTPEEIQMEIKEYIEEKTAELYPKKELAKRQFAIIKKYSPAKIGEKVTIQLNNSNMRLTGTYYGRDGIFIKLQNENIMLSDVADEYRYLFDEGLGDRIVAQEIEKMKKEELDKIEKFTVQATKDKEAELYPKYGHDREAGGQWRPHSEIVREFVEKSRVDYEKDKQNKISEIIKRHRILGTIKIELEN